MTPADFRALALAISGTVESAHMNHPDFRVGGKIFASLGAPDVRWGMVKLAPEDQRAVLEEAPTAFRPCAGAWGRQGYTNVLLDVASPPRVKACLALAAATVAFRARTGSKSARPKRPATPPKSPSRQPDRSKTKRSRRS